MYNKNYFSIIKNSEEPHTSALKSKTEKKGENIYLSEDKTLELSETITKKADSYECFTTVKNISKEDIDLNQVSSAFIEIKNEGRLKWFDENKYKIHFCQSAWLGEGQWNSATLDDLGMYQVFDDHQHRNYASISSKGSWSTSLYYPLVMVEDLENKKTHYFEVKSSGAWYIEFCIEYNENNEETLYVFISDSCEKNDGWNKNLKMGESYKTATVVCGTVEGGFEEAVRSLIDYKRADSKVKFKDDLPPVCFNDYMNCCWAMPSYEKTTALVDKASEMGVEIFCIDSGWQATLLDDTQRSKGDWIVSQSRFAPKTFKDIIEYINSKGMKCGAWLEIEAVMDNSAAYTELDNYVLKRRGHRIGTQSAFFDFTSEFIQDKMENVFDTLYSLGVRYIKNDYNQTLGIGCDGDKSFSETMRENMLAFCDFIDRIQAKYPDLIIENCGSGGMRCDSETLSHFHLQSTSDQEVYTCNPSIVCGSLSYMPPEKAGVWSYPYPVRYNDRMEYKVFEDDYSDGKQTIFNMVNSMMGLIYLSGRIDVADELNSRMIKEGIAVYKEIRKDYVNSYPIYPNGTFRLKDRGILTLGLYVPEKKIAYIAFWKINADKRELMLDLSKYGEVKNALKLYPSLEEYKVSRSGNSIKAELCEGNSAMLVKVEF